MGGGEGGEDPEPFAAALLPRGVQGDLKGAKAKNRISQSFGHLIQRADSLVKTPMLGKIEGKRSRGWQRMKWLGGITDSMDMSLCRPQEIVEDRGA